MSYNKTLKTNKRLDACFSRVLVWFIRQLTFELQAENFKISSGFWRLQSTSFFISRSHLLLLKPTKTSGEFPFSLLHRNFFLECEITTRLIPALTAITRITKFLRQKDAVKTSREFFLIFSS